MAAAHRPAIVPIGLTATRRPEPCSIVIFGGTGDLAHRKLIPALYNLAVDGLLPDALQVVGAARSEMSDDAWRSGLREAAARHSRRALDDAIWSDLAARCTYRPVRFDDGDSFGALAEHLAALDRDRGSSGNRLFYLAIPPSAFPAVIERLRESGLNRPGEGGSWARVVVEKPIGRDLASARTLNEAINRAFDERDVFRIDHYLGKETVQNLLVFRFANSVFEPLWNTKYVDHVQITVAESLGVEGRGGYFEEAGITRDILQNHLFQLLCLVAMEPPVSWDADAIRDEKVKVLRALRPLEPSEVPDRTVRAQYGSGVSGEARVPGYREEDDVSPRSITETYVAHELHVDNWRWASVPFYLRAGKRLPARVTEVALQFRDVPHRLFQHGRGARPAPNSLILRIQPDEGITLRFDAKRPGSEPTIEPVAMHMYYGEEFGEAPPDAYERLLLDAVLGDGTLFIRRDEVECAWAYVDGLFEGWQREGLSELPEYTAGTWGPGEADVLLARGGRTWRRPRASAGPRASSGSSPA